MSDSSKEKMRMAKLGTHHTAEQNKKTSNSLKGIVRSNETRKKMGAAKIGNKHGAIPCSNQKRKNISRGKGCRPIIDENGIIYQTQAEVAKALNVAPTNISYTLSGKHKTVRGIKIKYID